MGQRVAGTVEHHGLAEQFHLAALGDAEQRRVAQFAGTHAVDVIHILE